MVLHAAGFGPMRLVLQALHKCQDNSIAALHVVLEEDTKEDVHLQPTSLVVQMSQGGVPVCK